MLLLQNISKSYLKDHAKLQVLEHFSLTVATGEFVAVQGPSGCGKTTLLLTAGGLLHPDQGRVLLNDIDVYQLSADGRAEFRAKNLGFVFQQYHLIPYLTVLENVAAPNLALQGRDSFHRAKELVEYFGLIRRLNHRPAELSAGEKQRVALARALYSNPRVVLADEITGNLDDMNSTLILQYLREYCRDGGTVLMVTHDRAAAEGADRVVELE